MILDWFCICVCLVFNDFIQSDDKFSALTNSWVDLHNRQVSIERSRVYTEAYDVCLWMLCSRALHTQNSLSCDCFLAVHPSNWLVFVGQGFYSLFLISLSLFRFSFSFSLFLVFIFFFLTCPFGFFFLLPEVAKPVLNSSSLHPLTIVHRESLASSSSFPTTPPPFNTPKKYAYYSNWKWIQIKTPFHNSGNIIFHAQNG